jgi:hypothetical protein
MDPAEAADSVTPGEFILDPPTLRCLGFAWEIEGDDNRNSTADVEYREKGLEEWHEARPLLRVGGYRSGRTSDWLDVKNRDMLAGSILDLEEDTAYEVRITMRDSDGVTDDPIRTATVRTRAEPQEAEDGNVYHLMPPGTRARWPQNEFGNLYKAYYGGLGNLGDFNMVWERIVQPGDTILVHAGTYKADLDHYTDRMGLVPDGTYWLTAKGTEERPITIKAAGDGEVVFDGAGAEVLFNMMAADYHIIEGITFRNCGYAIFAGQQRVTGCKGLTVRNCRFENVRDGIYTLWNGAEDFYIADNVFFGRNSRDGLTGWGGPAEGRLKSNTAITLQGTGHVVCRNAIGYFWQAYHMGTAFQGWDRGGIACDIYNNDMHMLIDDGVEVDGCVRNVRVFRNRIVDSGSPISAQPVYGGPAYFFRNLTYNARCSLKFHEAWPSGLLVYQNTMVGGNTLPRGTYTNAHFRNNLFLRSRDGYPVAAFPSAGNGVTADYNGYTSQTIFKITEIDGFAPIMDKSQDPYWPLKKYPGQEANTEYASLAEFREATGHEQHGIVVDYGVFQNLQPPERPRWNTPAAVHPPSSLNFALNPDGAAVDAGMTLANVNEEFTSHAPDLGAYEVGRPVPHYGPAYLDGQDFDFQAAAEGTDAAKEEPPPPTMTAENGRLLVEAEDCRLTSYAVEKAPGYSGDGLAVFAGRAATQKGSLEFRAKVEPGDYAVSITYCDEMDGVCAYTLCVDGETVAQWDGDGRDGGPGKEPESKTVETFSGITLAKEPAVRLDVVKKFGKEYGRVDCLEFIRE